MSGGGFFTARRWLTLIILTVLLALLMSMLHVPAPELFAGLCSATILALLGRGPRAIPRAMIVGAQAVVGVLIGSLLTGDTLHAVTQSWWPILIVSVGTLALSMGSGMLFGLSRQVSALTGMLALTAGGASGVTGISRELGADERTVAVVQFLRLGIVTASMPIVVWTVFQVPHMESGASQGNTQPWLPSTLFLFACAALGIILGRIARLPAGALLGPLAVSAIFTLAGWHFSGPPPSVMLSVAFGIIGAQAGIRFTVESLRALSRVLPFAILLIIVVIGVCAALGIALAHLTGVSLIEGYLATTPGGIYAVLAFAAATHSDVAFVTTVQVVRIAIMLMVLPVLARLLTNRKHK